MTQGRKAGMLPSVVDRMLMEFLSGALADEFPDKKVYIAGLDVSRREEESDIEL